MYALNVIFKVTYYGGKTMTWIMGKKNPKIFSSLKKKKETILQIYLPFQTWREELAVAAC